MGNMSLTVWEIFLIIHKGLYENPKVLHMGGGLERAEICRRSENRECAKGLWSGMELPYNLVNIATCVIYHKCRGKKRWKYGNVEKACPREGVGSASGVLGLLSCSRTPLYAPRAKSPAALPEERHVLACTGWAGEIAGLFEHSLLLEIIDGIWQSQAALKEFRIIQQPQVWKVSSFL